MKLSGILLLASAANASHFRAVAYAISDKERFTIFADYFFCRVFRNAYL